MPTSRYERAQSTDIQRARGAKTFAELSSTDTEIHERAPQEALRRIIHKKLLIPQELCHEKRSRPRVIHVHGPIFCDVLDGA